MRTSASVGVSCLLCLGLLAAYPAAAGENPIGDFSGTRPLFGGGGCPPEDASCEICAICETAHETAEPCPETYEIIDMPPAKTGKPGGDKYDIGKDGAKKGRKGKPAFQPPGPPPIETLRPPEAEAEATPPTPEEVEAYRQKLERKLFDRYNSLPGHAGRVGMVSVVLSKPLDTSLDGKFIRAEFDQLVFDNWGTRLPVLEKEYYVVTFGGGGAETVRADPSVRVGLDKETVYSERSPLPVDPFRNPDAPEAFKPARRGSMPKWWRPEFPDSDCYDYF